MEFLFGLDNLRRHQCNIDLQSNSLKFPVLGLNLPFLPEHEIPKNLFTQPEAQQQLQQQQQQQQIQQRPEYQRQESMEGSAPPVSPRGPITGAVDEDKVQRLMQLGFPRDVCITALQRAGGNEEIAGSMLFSL